MGQGRRIKIPFIMCFAVLLVIAGSRPAQAKYFSNPYIVEQARGKAPNVKAYITGKDVTEKVTFSGKLGNKIEVSQQGETKVFAKSGEGVHYIILVDNSGSVDKGQFAEAKKQLASLRGSMKKKDRMSLYVVGTRSASGNKKNVLGKTAAGNKGKEIKKDKKRILRMKRDGSPKSKTVLYRSLNDVLAGNRAPAMRTVVLMVTDGEDDSAGKNNSRSSTMKNVKDAAIPVYGVLLKNVAKKPDNKKISHTRKILEEKNCRGYYEYCRGRSSKKKIKSAFSNIRDIIRNRTYVVHMAAPDNKPLKDIVKLRLNAGKGNKFVTVPVCAGVDYSSSVPDTEPPVIGEISKVNSNAITFTLTDNSGGVAGADQPANYIVKTKSEGEDGKVWNISSVNYNQVDGTVVLTFSEDLFTGDYVLTCTNITDDTNEANPVSQPCEFTFAGLDAGTVQRMELIRSYWWTVLIFLAVAVGVILIIIIKKKAVKIVEINPEELSRADSKRIRLTITDRTGAIRDVEWNVEGSLFIGRSDICNIYFDDERLSKQHFVIEVTKMGCYIEDLESTNGTFVNGVRMTNRRMLLDEDVITAGRERFVFHLINAEQNGI